MSERGPQIRDFIQSTDFADATLAPLPGDASFRRYVRVHKNGAQAMLMDAPPGKEDVRPFISVAEYLHAQGYSAPAILARNPEAGFILLEDLGDALFSKALAADAAMEDTLYGHAIELLAQWHSGDFSNPAALPLPQYDEALLMREVQLFCDWFMPQVAGKEKARALSREYLALWQEIIRSAPPEQNQFVHRDYHADNLLWLPGRDGIKKVGLLDFQDAVYGDAAYDLVSLLEDARRDVPPALAEKMLSRYLQASGADARRLRSAYALLGAQRNSKIIGIFSRLAARDGKQHYLNYLPRVWKHLEHDLAHPQMKALSQWIEAHVPQESRGIIPIAHDAQSLQLSA